LALVLIEVPLLDAQVCCVRASDIGIMFPSCCQAICSTSQLHKEFVCPSPVRTYIPEQLEVHTYQHMLCLCHVNIAERGGLDLTRDKIAFPCMVLLQHWWSTSSHYYLLDKHAAMFCIHTVCNISPCSGSSACM